MSKKPSRLPVMNQGEDTPQDLIETIQSLRKKEQTEKVQAEIRRLISEYRKRFIKINND
jgi:hypothetical protein